MVVQDDAEKDRRVSRHVSRHDNHRRHHDLGRRLDSRVGRCRLDVGVRRPFQLGVADLRCCLRAWEDHCHMGVVGHYRPDVVGHCHLGAVGRCRLLDVVDRPDVGVRLDVMNCLDLGERSWKAESAGDQGH